MTRSCEESISRYGEVLVGFGTILKKDILKFFITMGTTIRNMLHVLVKQTDIYKEMAGLDRYLQPSVIELERPDKKRYKH